MVLAMEVIVVIMERGPLNLDMVDMEEAKDMEGVTALMEVMVEVMFLAMEVIVVITERGPLNLDMGDMEATKDMEGVTFLMEVDIVVMVKEMHHPVMAMVDTGEDMVVDMVGDTEEDIVVDMVEDMVAVMVEDMVEGTGADCPKPPCLPTDNDDSLVLVWL